MKTGYIEDSIPYLIKNVVIDCIKNKERDGTEVLSKREKEYRTSYQDHQKTESDYTFLGFKHYVVKR